MAKKKSNFWAGIKNLTLIIICFGVLSIFYKGFLNVEDVYKLRYPVEYEDIPRVNRLLYATAILSLVVFGLVKGIVLWLI